MRQTAFRKHCIVKTSYAIPVATSASDVNSNRRNYTTLLSTQGRISGYTFSLLQTDLCFCRPFHRDLDPTWRSG